jgi:hypothetical protein
VPVWVVVVVSVGVDVMIVTVEPETLQESGLVNAD